MARFALNINKSRILGLGLLLLGMGATATASAQYYDDYNQSYDQGYDDYYDVEDESYFYDELAPYGQWINSPQYGNVWIPNNVGSDFQPYNTNGYWTMTQYGNTWVSNYDWGWAPFHYGRWTLDNYYGWMWIPGREWGPAWVSWKQGGGYYGWAPLGPNVSINIALGSYNAPSNWWVFIPQANLYYTNGYNRYYSRNNVNYYLRNSNYINGYYNHRNTRFVTGPSRGDVQTSTRKKVTVYNINPNSNNRNGGRIQGGNLNIFTPNRSAVTATNNSRNQVVPARQQAQPTTPSRNVNTRNNNSINDNNRNNSNRINNNANFNRESVQGTRTSNSTNFQRATETTVPPTRSNVNNNTNVRPNVNNSRTVTPTQQSTNGNNRSNFMQSNPRNTNNNGNNIRNNQKSTESIRTVTPRTETPTRTNTRTQPTESRVNTGRSSVERVSPTQNSGRSERFGR